MKLGPSAYLTVELIISSGGRSITSPSGGQSGQEAQRCAANRPGRGREIPGCLRWLAWRMKGAPADLWRAGADIHDVTAIARLPGAAGGEDLVGQVRPASGPRPPACGCGAYGILLQSPTVQRTIQDGPVGA